MKSKLAISGLIVVAAGLLAACGTTASPSPTAAPPEPTEAAVTGSAEAGGRLYDAWWAEAGVDEPTGDQPLWATQTTNTRTGRDTWRCKECHGWDYKGADGAYGSGSHATGFPGVLATAPGMSDAERLAWLDGTANADHNFSAMGEEAMANLVVFLRDGLVDVGPHIDAEKAAVGGDAAHGQELYGKTCTGCHGDDGRMLNFGSDEEPEYVGTIAVDNPWEFIHKVRAGQPGAQMPSAIQAGWSLQDVVDLLAYSQTLPTQADDLASVARGGRLYDQWWAELGVEEPSGDMPVWARQTTNTRDGSVTWRCKECHGWDYQGAEGAYGSGSHATGFPGVLAAQQKTAEQLLAQLTGGVDAEHDFSDLGEEALADLVNFLRLGVVDVSPWIDSSTKAAIGGNATHGQELFAASCASCHGPDGLLINFGSDEEPEFVGTIAVDNPWEFFHKVRMGQPGTAMPAGLLAGWSPQDFVDLLAFGQTLPVSAP
ncbi:MAG TPA: c-type cytochrome [Anaerolineales bacterium]|nr:c-type cytochrome [Anaerolineales bacterium]